MFRIVGIWRLSKLPYHYLLNTNYSVDEKFILLSIYTDNHQLLLINNTYRFGMLWRIWKSHKFLLFRSRNFIFMKQWIMQWLTLKNGWRIWAQITITIPIDKHHKRPDWPVCSNAIMKLPSVSIRVTVFGGWIVRDCQGLTKMWGSGCAGKWLNRQGFSRLNKNVGIRLCR